MVLCNFHSLQKSEIPTGLLETKRFRLSLLKWEGTLLQAIEYMSIYMSIWIYYLYRGDTLNICIYITSEAWTTVDDALPCSPTTAIPVLLPVVTDFMSFPGLCQSFVNQDLGHVYFPSSLWFPITTNREHVRCEILPEVRKTSRIFCPWTSCV